MSWKGKLRAGGGIRSVLGLMKRRVYVGCLVSSDILRRRIRRDGGGHGNTFLCSALHCLASVLPPVGRFEKVPGVDMPRAVY